MTRFPKSFAAALCVAFLTIAGAAKAHAIEPQSPRAPVASETTSVEDSIDRGSLGYELLGGSIGLLVGAGMTLAVIAQQTSCGGGGHGALPPCAMQQLGTGFTLGFGVAPLLITGGVIIGGNATGSNGRFLSTWGGALLGLLATGIVILPGTVHEKPPAVRAVGFAVVGLGGVGGALLFYRLSASAPRVTVAPTLDGRGAMFSIRGAL